MKKVIVDKLKTETVYFSDVRVESNMVVLNAGGLWYLLSEFPLGGKCFWKALRNSFNNSGGEFQSIADALRFGVGSGEVYSFKNLDEFIQFYQEKK